MEHEVICPICGADSTAKYRPFCSRRCADVDLGRWLTGSYVLPRALTDEDGADADTPSEAPEDDRHGRH